MCTDLLRMPTVNGYKQKNGKENRRFFFSPLQKDKSRLNAYTQMPNSDGKWQQIIYTIHFYV